MPLPKPNDSETKQDFISRCMADATAISEYEDDDQRLAVCNTQWEDNRAQEPGGREMRTLTTETMELRAATEGDDSPGTLVGYIAKFNKLSQDLGGFVESIRPKAFENALKHSDTRALFNHDVNNLLGRTGAGTLMLTENTTGLHFENPLPNTQSGRDVAESVKRGDITGNSFAFTTKIDEWTYSEKGPDHRELVEIDELFDVGPVTYPAYNDTTVAARSRTGHKGEETPESEAKELSPEEKIKAQRVDERHRSDLKRQMERLEKAVADSSANRAS